MHESLHIRKAHGVYGQNIENWVENVFSFILVYKVAAYGYKNTYNVYTQYTENKLCTQKESTYKCKSYICIQ